MRFAFAGDRDISVWVLGFVLAAQHRPLALLVSERGRYAEELIERCHTLSWAILERTPVGATLHYMDPEVDAGDIVSQKQIDGSSGDTGHSLYERAKLLELEVFREAWPLLVSGQCMAEPQDRASATTHRRGGPAGGERAAHRPGRARDSG